VHTVKELEVSTRLTLSSQKDYLQGDNSDIIATDSQKNTVYVLAKKFGVKSPEDFATILCNHFLSTYSHVTKVMLSHSMTVLASFKF
jgi:urate oxidase